MNRKILFLAFLFVFILSSCVGAKENQASVVADLGSYCVEESLFRQEMKLRTYFVRIEVEREYGVKLDDRIEAWSADYGGTTPLELLKQYALEDAVKAKALIVLANEHKILKTDNFDIISADYGGSFLTRDLAAADLPEGDEWRYSAFKDTVTTLLTQSVRDKIRDSDIESFLEKAGADYLNDYIRMSRDEEKSPALLAKTICNDNQRRGVVLDLMQDESLKSQMESFIGSNGVSVRTDVYNKILPVF